MCERFAAVSSTIVGFSFAFIPIIYFRTFSLRWLVFLAYIFGAATYETFHNAVGGPFLFSALRLMAFLTFDICT